MQLADGLTSCELGRCFQQAGLRGFVGKVSMDLNAPSDVSAVNHLLA